MIDLTGIIVDALKSIPKADLDAAFHVIYQTKLNTVLGCPKEELANLQAQLLQIKEIQQIFLYNQQRALPR